MRYLLMVYAQEQPESATSEQERQAYMAKWFSFTDEFQRSGMMKGGEVLQFTVIVITFRLPDGKRVTSDGPFAETKEQLGGFFIIDADNLDTALEWSAKMPHLPWGGSVEIRPIMEFNQ